MALGAAGVRQAVQAWFDAPAVQGLNRVYAAMPWWAGGDQWDIGLNGGWGAIGYVHITDEHETRIAYGGIPGGIKQVTYQVGLVLLFKYQIPTQLPAGADESEYVTYLDALIDGVKNRLRQDPTLGTGSKGVVWQAGEGRADVVIRRDLPRRKGQAVQSWQVLEVEVVENVFG